MPDLELTVESLAVGGDGVAHADDGRVVFVAGGLPGDRVTADVIRAKKKWIRARVTQVVEAGPERVDPPCPHVAAGCGGCGWQHLGLDAQRRAKVRLVRDSLERIGGVAPEDSEVELAAALPDRGFRTSIRVLLGPDGPSFRGAGSHDLVPVDSCLVAHPLLEELLDGSMLGHSGEVTLRVGAATGERLAVYEDSMPRDTALPSGVGVADDGGPDGACIHDVVAGHRFRISAQSFFQTRTDGAEALVDAVRTAGGDAWGSGSLLDLYGGVGLFAAVLGESMAVTVVESSKSSAADAVHNLAHLDEVEVARVNVERWRPLPADLVIADPPRAGLGAVGVDKIAATGAGRLVLVSCDAGSFGRDVQLLADAGYERVSSCLVDLFPHTPHVEVVSRFDLTKE